MWTLLLIIRVFVFWIVNFGFTEMDRTQKRQHNLVFVKCRVKFYNQEIVFFRQDLLYRMRRSCLVTPSSDETKDPFKHVNTSLVSFIFLWFISFSGNDGNFWNVLVQLVYTITHQSHLCPLPLMVQPIIWNYDHSLRLYPTPHTVFINLLIVDLILHETRFKTKDYCCFKTDSIRWQEWARGVQIWGNNMFQSRLLFNW